MARTRDQTMSHRTATKLIAAFNFTLQFVFNTKMTSLRQRFVKYIVNCLNGTSSSVAYVVQNSLLISQMAAVVTRILFLCRKLFQCDPNFLIDSRMTAGVTRLVFFRPTTSSDICTAKAPAKSLARACDDVNNSLISLLCNYRGTISISNKIGFNAQQCFRRPPAASSQTLR
jgi:hypothetical protein